MTQHSQVSGGACSLVMYPETKPGIVADAAKGVQLAFLSEGFQQGASKKQSSVIRAARGAGKPTKGLPQMSGSLESAPYVPQIGYLLRALCGAASSKSCVAKTVTAAAVIDLGDFVGIPCTGHGFVQDAVISIVGTQHYDGSYRVEAGTTADMLAINVPYLAETLAATAKIYRGRVPLLAGKVLDISGGKVALPVAGGVHSLNVGEKVIISGTTNYDGEHILAQGTQNTALVIEATFTEETLNGTALAEPLFFEHSFALPQKQPTVCFEKYLDFDQGAAAFPYRRFGFCKVNGFNFSLGGDDELKFSLDFAVGKETQAAAPLDASPTNPPAVTMDTIEGSIWVANTRRGDIESVNVSNAFGIDAKAAVGDRGQYSRMSEGDPELSVSLSAFLETDELQNFVTAASTVSVAIGICAAQGEEFWIEYPEAELDSAGATISGKEGLMQDFTVMPFVDHGLSVMQFRLINRVQSYQ